MAEASRIVGQVLEQLHYIHVPETLRDADLAGLEANLANWAALPVDLHVLDLKQLKSGSERFFQAIKKFSALLPAGHLVSMNVAGELKAEIVRAGLESAFRLVNSAQELTPSRTFAEGELKRLFIRYLIEGAYEAVEISLNSTVSCDENYLAKVERVPFHEFNLVSFLDVRGEFLNAQLRLCASVEVLTKLAGRMLGAHVVIEPDMIESMSLEMLNLIYGYAKSQLNDKESFRLPSAIPRRMSALQMGQIQRTPNQANLAILPLVTPMGPFYVEVEM